MKRIVLVTLGLALAFGGGAQAAPCRDSNGKFITCPKPVPTKCRDAKGKFVKCGAASTAG